MADVLLNVAAALLIAGLPVVVYRFVKGPSSVDRLLAVETAVFVGLGLVTLFTVRYSHHLLPAALVVSLVGIISAVAVSRYISRDRLF